MVATAKAINELADRKLMAMVEPFWSSRVDGKVRNDLSADAVIKSVGVCSALGRTSAYTWMKLPVVPEMERVMDSTTLPTLLLGGDPDTSPEETFASLAGGAGAAVGARPGGRPDPALPGRRRRRGRGRHRRLDGAVTWRDRRPRSDRPTSAARDSSLALYVPAGSAGAGAVRPGDHAGVGGLGLLQPAGGDPGARRVRRVRHRARRDDRAAAVRRRRGHHRRRRHSGWPAGRACSPPSPTPPTCRSTRRSG